MEFQNEFCFLTIVLNLQLVLQYLYSVLLWSLSECFELGFALKSAIQVGTCHIDFDLQGLS